MSTTKENKNVIKKKVLKDCLGLSFRFYSPLDRTIYAVHTSSIAPETFILNIDAWRSFLLGDTVGKTDLEKHWFC